jgi:hypothetical protein
MIFKIKFYCCYDTLSTTRNLVSTSHLYLFKILNKSYCLIIKKANDLRHWLLFIQSNLTINLLKGLIAIYSYAQHNRQDLVIVNLRLAELAHKLPQPFQKNDLRLSEHPF